nr:hypothetical protein [Sorangium cellulosum]
MVHALAADLLGRHVRGRPDRDPRGRPVGEGVARELRHAEVEQLGEAAAARLGGHEDVLGLQIAVRDPGRVRGVERVGDALEEGDGAARREADLAPDQRAEREPVEQLHDEVVPPVDDAEREDVDDVAVPDAVHRARLADEARDDGRIGREPLVQHLDRDPLADERVLSRVDVAERARAEQPLDAVLADHGARLQRRVLVGEGLVGEQRAAVLRAGHHVIGIDRAARGAGGHRPSSQSRTPVGFEFGPKSTEGKRNREGARGARGTELPQAPCDRNARHPIGRAGRRERRAAGAPRPRSRDRRRVRGGGARSSARSPGDEAALPPIEEKR